MSTAEVIVTVDGVPRPAVVVDTDGDRTLVRFRDAGGFREEWVPTSAALAVEAPGGRPPYVKLLGLAVLAAVGLLLVLYPGSDRPLSEAAATRTPTPTATAAPTGTTAPTATVVPSPASGPVRAVVLGDSFSAGKGNPEGTPTALQLAARSLHWTASLQVARGSGFTTPDGLLARVTAVAPAPAVLVLQAGASDTSASPQALTAAAGAVLDAARSRFPQARLVLVGPFAMEQPADGQLVRVDRTLAAVAKAHRVAYVDPIAGGWVTAANAASLTAATGFYPNAAGHAYLAERLAAALAKVS